MRSIYILCLMLAMIQSSCLAGDKSSGNFYGNYASSVAFNKGSVTVRNNIFGGQNYSSGSKTILSSRPNSFGGQNYYSGSTMQSYSRTNIFGGQTFFGGVK